VHAFVCARLCSLTEHLHGAAVHMQRYLNCDGATVVSGCTYADLWSLIARVDKLDSFHLEQIDNSGALLLMSACTCVIGCMLQNY